METIELFPDEYNGWKRTQWRGNTAITAPCYEKKVKTKRDGTRTIQVIPSILWKDNEETKETEYNGYSTDHYHFAVRGCYSGSTYNSGVTGIKNILDYIEKKA
jgi:hypothetical protein